MRKRHSFLAGTYGIPAPSSIWACYIRFEYDWVTVGEDGVSFDIINAGDRDGDEIAQLYVSLSGAKIFRPAMELKGSERVSLKPAGLHAQKKKSSIFV